MASIDPRDADPAEFEGDAPPPRPTTPPIRRGFVWVLLLLMMMTILVYGVPLALDRIGFAYEAGRARAASEALAKLDEAGVIERASSLFRLATNAVSPAVVNIRTQSFDPAGGASVGSGVIIDKANGYIVTNNHVIQGADLIVVRVGRRTELPAELVGADPKTDLAVVRVKGRLPADAPWGDSEHLEIGEWVVAIGSPFGLERSVTVGIVSATERSGLGIVGFDQAYENFIQTDASINPGNSGGPLVNLRGQVIGINTAIVSDDGAFKGIGLAIPAEMARKVAAQLIEAGKVTRGFLGVASRPVQEELKDGKSATDGQGAVVVRVLPGSPADQAGVKLDDVIVAIDGQKVTDPASLRNKAFTLKVGSDAAIEVVRGGKPLTLHARIAAMSDDRVAVPPGAAVFGLAVKEVPPDADGVLVVERVLPGSPADKAGLKPGDRVVSFGLRPPIGSKADFDVGVAQLAMTGGMQLLIVRDGQRQFVNVGTVAGPRP